MNTIDDKTLIFTISYWFSNSDDFRYLHDAEKYPLISYSITTNLMNAINDNYIEDWVKKEMGFQGLDYGSFNKSNKVRKDDWLTWHFGIYSKNHNSPIGRWTIDCVHAWNMADFRKFLDI